MFNLEEFLLMREKRVEIQNSIINKFKKPILVLRANYPGEDKNNFIPKSIVEVIKKEITEIFNSDILIAEKISSIEGPTYIFSIDYPGIEIKKIAMIIEDNHTLGRCVDIDVFDETGYPFSRSDFGGEKRKCLICENMAFVCGRTGAHSHKQIQNVIQEKYEHYLDIVETQESISNTFSNNALKSIVLEVSSSPSFGLVSPLTKGAHKDMDFFTFLDSSFALTPYLKSVSKAGYSPLPIDLIFKKIRYMGKVSEQEMFLATNNVNTHKGMIFLIGITLAMASKAKFENLSFRDISNLISEMCKDILKDFDNIKSKSNLTHGEKLFLNHGIVGVRGIVKKGLDIIFDEAIDVFENSLLKENDINDSMVRTLIFLMSSLEDTTILHRHDIHVLNNVKLEAMELHSMFENSPLDISLLKEIENKYSKDRISPGGAADLLAVTIFLHSIKNMF
ncbi:citrate lyase holo-[acyl-carrier protein] synthase [Cetobacterium sp. 8H]|uniref:citrate lyase holo-[acyl-carrier protein] synthase n=1 Tax=Cetobacterium sp. 8H TaxID=2759681 RepID=UPI00163CAF80|nr:citrate lyase holo-[acyl-carrier protein] synthase [Cetobacterium sp. 8H]MBC2850732.1 citrate lyase holo-[acyl-carrier protein] synthase [Cetobacterium sp. 8H]